MSKRRAASTVEHPKSYVPVLGKAKVCDKAPVLRLVHFGALAHGEQGLPISYYLVAILEIHKISESVPRGTYRHFVAGTCSQLVARSSPLVSLKPDAVHRGTCLWVLHEGLPH